MRASPLILNCFGLAAEAEQVVKDEARYIGTGALGEVLRGEISVADDGGQNRRYSAGEIGVV